MSQTVISGDFFLPWPLSCYWEGGSEMCGCFIYCRQRRPLEIRSGWWRKKKHPSVLLGLYYFSWRMTKKCFAGFSHTAVSWPVLHWGWNLWAVLCKRAKEPQSTCECSKVCVRVCAKHLFNQQNEDIFKDNWGHFGWYTYLQRAVRGLRLCFGV